ncbi:MAG TPA: alpha/beta fold hydrolase, partial [Anaerolineales bacterium]|nr:alpha/beta fold hydrolase [Anaerolineales bacterium]
PTLLVPHSEPFLLPGGKTGCILIHGFTAMPEEMRDLGDYLHRQGYTVLGLRLAGHATDPRDLARTAWTDWLISVEEGLALLKHLTDRVFLIGQSMGGMVSLTAAGRYPVAGVIALATPFLEFTDEQIAWSEEHARKRKPMLKQDARPHAELGIRREAGYPAYAAAPPSIQKELYHLQKAMASALPVISCPVFVIQSHHDEAIPPNSLEQITTRLTTPRVQTLWLDHFSHSAVWDPKRGELFPKIHAFLASV